MSEPAKRTALVLGGGGVLGISWQVGVLAGLAREGVELGDAAVIVGTSAGATVAAQLATSPLEDLYAAQVEQTAAPEPRIDVDLGAVLKSIDEIIANESDPEVARRAIGALALADDRVSEADRRSLIETRIGTDDWPLTDIRVVAIDARTGRMRVFDRTSGVGLVDAVAASSAIPVIWPAVTIGGDRYYDGGFRSVTNTDVAEGCDRIVVLEVMARPDMADVGETPSTSQVLKLSPDQVTLDVLGRGVMDSRWRRVAAEAGYWQGVAMAPQVGHFWTETP